MDEGVQAITVDLLTCVALSEALIRPYANITESESDSGVKVCGAAMAVKWYSCFLCQDADRHLRVGIYFFSKTSASWLQMYCKMVNY